MSQRRKYIHLCSKLNRGDCCFFAINKLGLVNARIFNGSKDKKLLLNLLDFSSRVILTDRNNLATLSRVIEESEIEIVLVMDEVSEEELCRFKSAHKGISIYTWQEAMEMGKSIKEEYSEKVGGEDMASILYTRGSSGQPKPICFCKNRE